MAEEIPIVILLKSMENLRQEVVALGDFRWLQFSDLHLSGIGTFDTALAQKSLLDFL